MKLGCFGVAEILDLYVYGFEFAILVICESVECMLEDVVA